MFTALTIAGSDSSGGAGIQADIKTMTAHGVYAMSAITALTAQNTTGVQDILEAPPAFLAEQLDCVFTDIPPDAVKVGMLSTPACMEAVASKLREYRPAHVVIDPVMYAKNGSPLMQESSIDTLIKTVIPAATLLTPNIPEAEKISEMKITTPEDMQEAAKKIYGMGAGAVLVKGGHYIGDARDILFDGREFHTYVEKRIDTKNTHGTGCTLSSAIASYLALGEPLPEAVGKAKAYVTGAIEHALPLGNGCGPTNHFFRWWA